MRKHEKNLKILLTENNHSHDTPPRASFCLPLKDAPAFLSYPHAGKTVSEEHRCLHKQIRKPCIR
jgi:hypothetical protein